MHPIPAVYQRIFNQVNFALICRRCSSLSISVKTAWVYCKRLQNDGALNFVHFFWTTLYVCMLVTAHCVSKNFSPNSWPCLRQILTDFKNSFTDEIFAKFHTKPYINYYLLRFPYIVALPREVKSSFLSQTALRSKTDNHKIDGNNTFITAI